MNCSDHHDEAVGTCTWCSRPICKTCVSWASNHKLCPSCFAKLSSQGIITQKKRPGRLVRNVDEKLSPDRILEGKKMLEKKQDKRPRIRNVPDWPVLK